MNSECINYEQKTHPFYQYRNCVLEKEFLHLIEIPRIMTFMQVSLSEMKNNKMKSMNNPFNSVEISWQLFLPSCAILCYFIFTF